MRQPERDPRHQIAVETQFADHDIAGGWHAVNLELASVTQASRRQQLQALRELLGGEGRIAQAQIEAHPDLTVATAEVSAIGLRMLDERVQAPAGDQPAILRFEYAQFLKPPRTRRVPGLSLPGGDAFDAQAGRAAPRKGSRSGVTRVVFAVIDHGCPFMHPLLCTQSAGVRWTRVRALWDQQASDVADPRTAPVGFGYGTVLSSQRLNAVIHAAAGDEDRAYRSLGYQAMRLRESHGAHALGMLLDDTKRPRGSTRDGTGTGARPDLLFVQLPQGLLCAPSRAVLSRYVLDALVWIQAQCAADERVVLSLSEGSSQGPHDGSSIVERALQAFTQWGPGAVKSNSLLRNRVYIAAGNGFEEKLHAQVTLKASAPASFLWRVPPASELPASVEIWLPLAANGLMGDVQVDLIAPDGKPAASVGPGEIAHAPTAGAAAYASIASGTWRGQGCTLCVIRLAPTAAARGQACAPFGDWTIRLTAKTDLQPLVHLYIGRIKQMVGFPLRTVQSTFVANQRSGCVEATGEGTLQGLATAQGVTGVGGVVGVTGPGGEPPAARYSSRGPLRNQPTGGPALSVRVDDGPVLRGRRSIGNRSGVSFRMDGTSVGAPLAARLDHARKDDPPRPGANGEVLPDPVDS